MRTPKQVNKMKLSEVVTMQRGKRTTGVDGGGVECYGAGRNPTKKTDRANAFAPCIRLTIKGTIGECYLHTVDFWAEGACLILTPKEDLRLAYLFHFLKLNQATLKSFAVGEILPKMDLDRLNKLEIDVPDLDYQDYVCDFLANMQEEIIQAILNHKKVAKLQKKGMGNKILEF